MACARARARRCLATNYAHHLVRRLPPSIAHAVRNDDDDDDHHRGSEPRKPPPAFHSRWGDPAASPRPAPALFSGRRSSLGLPLPFGVDPSLLLRRYSSSAEGSGEISYVVNDPAEVLSDGSVEAAAAAVAAAVPPAPFPGEVAAAAADSYLPVWALQHVIDAIHSFTGLNWWASIALTTILIRGATVPLLVNQMKASLKLSLMRPELEQLKEHMNSMDPQSVQESQKKMQALFKKHGVTPFTPLKGLLFQGPIFISFFFAISNMVEKVPSLKGGGAFWFTDLTTPDPQYIFPVLTALSFLATVELNMQEGMEGNPMAKNMKNFSRVMALMTVPFTAHFPKAIFCYWVTSNLFSLLYGFVLRRPPVRQFLGLPELVPQPASSGPSNFSFLTGPNSSGSSNSSPSVKESEQSKTPERRVSSSSVISQRIRNLEKTVKARNIKPKKR